MKKLFLSLMLFVGISAGAQTIRGSVLEAQTCRFDNNGGYRVVKRMAMTGSFIRITNDFMRITGNGSNRYYRLSNKIVDNDIVHYDAVANGKLYVLALRECDGKLIVGLLPMNGDSKFIQYIVKYFKK